MMTAPFHCRSGVASLSTKVLVVQMADNVRKGSLDPSIPLIVTLFTWTMRVSRLILSKKIPQGVVISFHLQDERPVGVEASAARPVGE